MPNSVYVSRLEEGIGPIETFQVETTAEVESALKELGYSELTDHTVSAAWIRGETDYYYSSDGAFMKKFPKGQVIVELGHQYYGEWGINVIAILAKDQATRKGLQDTAIKEITEALRKRTANQVKRK